MPVPADPAFAAAASSAGITVLERGWLSSNNTLLHRCTHDGPGGCADCADGAVLVDSGHVNHAAQTVALVHAALQARCDDAPLAAVVNTHLHSDHCGGNAALQRRFGCRLTIPSGQWDAALAWDEEALSYRATGQHCERFVPDAQLRAGQTLQVGRQRWLALAAPGHDPHALILFNAEHGIVISADALWEHGFGVVFPELDGENAFDDVAAVLALIESLSARWAIPGHGAPFGDVPGALHRARERLAAFRAKPARHARHAVKALVKYHLLEERQQAWPELLAWFSRGSLYRQVWHRLGRPGGSLAAFAEQTVQQLADAGVLAVRDGVVFDR